MYEDSKQNWSSVRYPIKTLVKFNVLIVAVLFVCSGVLRSIWIVSVQHHLPRIILNHRHLANMTDIATNQKGIKASCTYVQ